MSKRILEPSSTNIWKAIGRLSLRPVQSDPGSTWHERTGIFSHALGFVSVWQGWASNAEINWTTLEVIDRDGYMHTRQWKRVHPRKTVARLCREMIEELLQ